MSDRRWMALALGLGARGLGRVWPNPAVGCVLVRAGRVVGRGWTAPGGRPHAEIVALQQAGGAARGATAYVTLEPCNHQGQTGPCAQALIDAGVARVVVAMADPNPVAGGGLDRLRAAGIAVESGVLEAQAAEAHRGFVTRIQEGRPMVTLKLATSLDGRIATASGESQWITGPEARRRVHGMRMVHDAVLVGAGTARADDPSLTVRGMGAVAQPGRVVMSRRLGVSVESKLGRSARDVPVWMIHGPDAPKAARDAWHAAGARLFEVATGAGGQVEVGAAMQALGAAGLTRVFCEGGGSLAASLLGADLVDDLSVFSGGAMLGAEGVPAIGALGIAALAEAPRFTLRGVERVGADALAHWRRNPA
ncbi:bifunctional diaminohydroxyphosphoribosylaminopyrimidine deaminase/5-amino-6-(5-phosphoribosylamino)uracil reductase RibD [Hasllibacter sp. MH4015]|uniref:bifunctional diaminohydroxyphosphoribosylaminopyrimidine deaminase/5-amino-6-(5-phosphoribosylamino)uracil reductase RibD n=1 Tax=Hasllibacter sp. MH4015 TaxID=2854029 RepID=UPI001CD77584|nr:bifunctional diaminohydroxyphosphoribosylaminopyrimidine deaminase/5-amino-6-(5-phosphoribosylamino)uracil reductase RibD [Hasllibacter sp. MH4015]